MNKKEITSRLDEIIEFSGVERFIDTPVKRYSSGMYARLAFSVATHLDPEILIVDEVLSVGDAAFQRKCEKKIEKFTSGGRTVLFVSHSMASVSSFCTRCLLFEEGRITWDGKPEETIHQYAVSVEPTAEGEAHCARPAGDPPAWATR